MSHLFEVTFMDGNEWKIPFNLAIFLHLSIFFGAIYGPGLFSSKPPFQDIYTVDLISAVEPLSQPLEEPPKPASKEIEKPKKPEVSIASSAQEPTQPKVETPAKPVSIKPLKRKKINKTAKVVDQRKKLEKEHKRNLEKVKDAERKAAEAARLAANEAVQQLKNMLRETNSYAKPTQTTAKPSSGRKSRSSSKNVIENQYYASVFSRLEPHWKSPVHMTWGKDLAATIVIRIAKDGTIIDQFFEQRSGDRLFDQFVLKALQDGSPLPPIPAALQKNNVELGLRFVPGSIN